MNDAADHTSVVHTRLAARVLRQMRLYPRKLSFREPELMTSHTRFLAEAVNHTEPTMPISLWVRALKPALDRLEQPEAYIAGVATQRDYKGTCPCREVLA